MDVKLMRDKVKRVYQSPNWEERVDKMKDDQIIALYYKFLDQKKIKEN